MNQADQIAYNAERELHKNLQTNLNARVKAINASTPSEDVLRLSKAVQLSNNDNLPDISIQTQIDAGLKSIDDAAKQKLHIIESEIWIDKTIQLRVGADKQFKKIQDAFNFVRGKRISTNAEVQILVDDGVHTQSIIWHGYHPDGLRIRLIGNAQSPESCVLRFIPDGNGFCHGLILEKADLLELSGFTFELNANSHRSLYLRNARIDYIHPNSLIFDGKNQAKWNIHIADGGYIYAKDTVFKNTVHGVLNDEGGTAKFDHIEFIGGTDQRQAIYSSKNSNTYIHNSDLSNFKFGTTIYDGATVSIDNVTASNNDHCAHHNVGGYLNVYNGNGKITAGLQSYIGIQTLQGGMTRLHDTGIILDGAEYNLHTDDGGVVIANSVISRNAKIFGYACYGHSYIHALNTQNKCSGNKSDYNIPVNTLDSNGSFIKAS